MTPAPREPGAARGPVDNVLLEADEALRERLLALDDPLSATDHTVRDGELSNLRLRGAHLRRVVVERTRLVGVDASGGEFHDVRVDGASLQLALLTEADLARVTFERVDLREASFAAARLQDVLFVDCRLDGTDFREARARNCALRGCTLDGAEGLPGLLAGSAMPWPDVVASAGAFAQALGLRVED